MDKIKKNCIQQCTAESLKSANIKVLTSSSLEMIENAEWYTDVIMHHYETIITPKYADSAFGQERCTYVSSCSVCNDNVITTVSWLGKVGLSYMSDVLYANGWLSANGWTITPYFERNFPSLNSIFLLNSSYGKISMSNLGKVLPSVYLKSNIKIIGGNGADEPYKLAM